MSCEELQEGIEPIRLRHRDNKPHDAQLSGSEGILDVVLAIATAVIWAGSRSMLGRSLESVLAVQ